MSMSTIHVRMLVDGVYLIVVRCQRFDAVRDTNFFSVDATRVHQAQVFCPLHTHRHTDRVEPYQNDRLHLSNGVHSAIALTHDKSSGCDVQPSMHCTSQMPCATVHYKQMQRLLLLQQIEKPLMHNSYNIFIWIIHR